MSEETSTDPHHRSTEETFFSLPSEIENHDHPQPPSDVLMETVSLETSADSAALNVHFKVSSQDDKNASTSKADEVNMDLPDRAEPVSNDSVTVTSLSLSQYFDNSEPQPVQDTMGHNFFDSLSSGLSPMMKSVADITTLDSSVEVAVEATSNDSQLEQTPESPLVETVQSQTPVDDTSVLESNSEVLEETLTTPTEPPNQLLCTLFSEDKSGSDLLGKAFFDSLSNQANCEASADGSNVSPLSTPSNGPQSLDFLYLDPQEKDQFYDAWIPSPKTREVLTAMATSSQGSFFPEKNDLTMPGLLVNDPMGDPVKSLLLDLNMEEANSRACLTADRVTQDDAGLCQLIKANCLGAAIILAGRLLTKVGQGMGTAGHPTRHSPYSLQLWFTRIALFVKTRKFQYAELESQPFGNLDKPDIYYEFYPDVFTGRKGSMAPYAFRLLLAECPQFLGNYCGALDRLYTLLATVQKILQNLDDGLAEDGEDKELSDHHRKASVKLWQHRECKVLFAILNCMAAQKDYAMAIDVIHQLLQKIPSKTAEIQSALGKIYLQLGDVHAASSCFNQVSALRSQMAPNIKFAIEDLVHKAFMCIVQNSYAEAYKHFNQALGLEPANTVLVNNMAVCLLYMGRLKEAISLMEGVVMQKETSEKGSPDRSSVMKRFHEGLLFNTCILYELECFQCDLKKKDVLKVVAQNVGDSFQTTCLKIDVKTVK